MWKYKNYELRFSFDMFFAVSHYTEVLGGHVIYPIWFYEKDHKNGKDYPISPSSHMMVRLT